METNQKEASAEKNEKNWIKSGIICFQKDLGDIPVTVDYIKRKPIKSQPGRNVVVGVHCHWIKDGKFEKGLFHTRELAKEPFQNAH